MDNREVPVQITIGNVTARTVAGIARSGDDRARHLASFLRAFADQLDPAEEVDSDAKSES